MLYKNTNFSPADVDPVQGIIKGYFAHFGSKDSDGDVIHKSAFDRSVAEHGPLGTNRIKHIVNHDKGRPAGAIKELGPDTVGLAYVSQLLKMKSGKFIPDAEMIMAGVDSGYNFEHSIGYKEVPGKTQKERDYNHLLELKLFEGSTLTFYGANANTPIMGLKESDFSNATLQEYILKYHALSAMLHTGEWSDEAYQKMQQLHDAFGYALKSRQVPLVTTNQKEHNEAAAQSIADLITRSLKLN